MWHLSMQRAILRVMQGVWWILASGIYVNYWNFQYLLLIILIAMLRLYTNIINFWRCLTFVTHPCLVQLSTKSLLDLSFICLSWGLHNNPSSRKTPSNRTESKAEWYPCCFKGRAENRQQLCIRADISEFKHCHRSLLLLSIPPTKASSLSLSEDFLE